MTATPPGR